MYTLGINAAYHDSAACLVRDGVVLAAAEEERFNRVKHGKRPVPFSAWELPYAAIDYCLSVADIALSDIDHVAYSYDPAQMAGHMQTDQLMLPMEPSTVDPGEGWSSPWEPLFYSYVVNAPRQLRGGAPHHLQKRFNGNGKPRFEWHYVEHHLCHEASAFLASPFESAAVMTLDGRGERATTTLGVWRDNGFRRLSQVDFPSSLGLLYEDVTRHLGFLHSSDEYKVMALASYGKPIHADFFRGLFQWADDASYALAAAPLAQRFGPPRRRGERIEPLHLDIAASLQLVLEESVERMARWLRERSGETKLCMAGGVALNCVMNARLRDSGIFDEVWVQPAAGDAGTALGAALWTDWKARGEAGRQWCMDDAYLGPAYTDEDIETSLQWAKLPYRRLADVAEETATLLADNKIVGWFQHRMEFGPRALGARSILASPIDPRMQSWLNDLKDREDFRPVAPAVTEEAMFDWFAQSGAGKPANRAPFMLFVYRVQADKAKRIPAAVHVDGTARVQTVSAVANPRYHALLEAFARITGVPVLVNTSFNVRGEPIVCTPRDAIESFFSTPLDALVIGSFLVEKT